VTAIHQMAPRSTTQCAKHYTDAGRHLNLPPPPGCPWGEVGGTRTQCPRTRTLRSGVRDPCNTRGVWQTDRHTFVVINNEKVSSRLWKTCIFLILWPYQWCNHVQNKLQVQLHVKHSSREAIRCPVILHLSRNNLNW